MTQTSTTVSSSSVPGTETIVLSQSPETAEGIVLPASTVVIKSTQSTPINTKPETTTTELSTSSAMPESLEPENLNNANGK